MTPEEKILQDEALARIFGNSGFLDARLAALDPQARPSVWFVDDVGIDPTPGIKSHDYELRCGAAMVNLRVGMEWVFLDWRSELPGFLSFARDKHSYDSFMEFILAGLPSMLYGFNDEEARRGYLEGSRVDLSYRANLQAGYARTYKFNSIKDRAALATELVTDSVNILSLSATGGNQTPQVEKGVMSMPFNLSFYLPNSSDITPIMYLGIPQTHRTVVGWNESVLGWALSTHVDREKFPDIGQVATNLRDQIVPIISAALPGPTDL